MSTRRPFARVLAVAAVGATPALAVPAAFAATVPSQPGQPAPEQPAPEQPAPEQPAPEQPAPEQPVPNVQLGSPSVDAPNGYHGSVTITVPGCDYQSTQQPAITWVHVGGESLKATSDAQSPGPATITVPVHMLGDPGGEVSIGANCEIGTWECPPAPQGCLGTALLAVPDRRWQIPFPHYLAPGQALDAAHPSVSTGLDGTGARLTLTPSGNLVQYGLDGRQLWASNTSGSDVQLRAQDDGNVVLYADAGTATPKPLWATWTQGNPGARIALHEDGRLAVHSTHGDMLWSTASEEEQTKQPVVRQHELNGPTTLTAGHGLGSTDGRTTLLMQEDGNLVAYGPGNQVLWHSRTHGNRGARLQLQADGNLVVYSRTGKALWNSRTGDAQRLTVQDDGNVVLYSRAGTPLWHTGSFLWREHSPHGAAGVDEG